MISTRKSPRKSKNKQDNYGLNRGDKNDGGTNRGCSKVDVHKTRTESSVKNRRAVGYKKSRQKSLPPSRKKSTDMLSSSSESEYEEKSDSEDDRRDRTRGSSKQSERNVAGREYADDSANANEDGHRLIVTTKSGYKQQRARQNTHASVNLGGRDESAREYGNNSPSTDENGHDEGSVNKFINKSLRKRMFEDEEEDKGTDDDNEDLECDDENNQRKTGWMLRMRNMEQMIDKLKREKNMWELKLERTTRIAKTDKLTWTGEEINFVKDINDFCKEKLYPKEKFLRKNWHEYLPHDRRSFYSLCMNHLSIPEGSDPKDIWGRVVVPAVRDKYQSMKCNLNNKIKSVYLGKTILLLCASQYLFTQCPQLSNLKKKRPMIYYR